MLYLANGGTGALDLAPPYVNPDDGTDYLNTSIPLPPVSLAPAGGFDPFDAHGLARPSTQRLALVLRPFDQWTVDTATGGHSLIARQASGFPVGGQLPLDGPQRTVYAPIPQAWDAGFYGNPEPSPAVGYAG